MSCEEHYFENLLYHDKDCPGECNKNALSPEVQYAIEICADYVRYTMFNGKDDLKLFLNCDTYYLEFEE